MTQLDNAEQAANTLTNDQLAQAAEETQAMTDINTEVNRYAEDAIKDAAMLSLVGQHGVVAGRAIEHYELDTDADWLDLLDIMALEIYGTARVTHTRQDLQSITVVTGTGGPHTEFEVDYNDNVTGRAIWGSSRAEKFDTIPGLFDTLAPLVEGME